MTIFFRLERINQDSKRELLIGAAMEISVLRYADRYKEDLNEILDAETDKFLATIGISEKLRQQVAMLMMEFNALNLDHYEVALVAALCATSPDRGIREPYDYKVLSTTQVILYNYLNIFAPSLIFCY